MFEEICLVCGKHLNDGQAYCSEDCRSLDTSSPSISSASSLLSSPNLGYTTGGDVPPLVPSALGFALNKYSSRHRNHHSISSSSASSTSWSGLTDDEEDVAAPDITRYHHSNFYNSADSLYEGSSKSANFADTLKPSALSYARRPSGTNNRATVPNLHKRTSSAHVHHIPWSTPLQSHVFADDDGGYYDLGLSSRDESDADAEFYASKPVPTMKTKRSRASLPAYFSLLQMSNSTDRKQSSPVSSSSGNTIARLSPPTPKIPVANLVSGLTLSSSTIPSLSARTTPRGRRHVQGTSRHSQSSRYSSSSSEPHSRTRRLKSHTEYQRGESTIDEFSFPSITRGRTVARRNSSPPPKTILSTITLKAHGHVSPVASNIDTIPTHGYKKFRGRAQAQPSDNADAPGFGNGRSGLLNRERVISTRPTQGL